jgi:Zn-dependent alcohol dehydrogenase
MTSRFVQVSKPNGPFEIVEQDIPDPGAAQVRIKVQACGICHGDSAMKEGIIPRHPVPKGSWS